MTAVASGPGAGAFGIRVGAGGGSVAVLDAVNVIASGSAGDVAAETDGLPGSTATATLDHSNFSTTDLNGTGASITLPAESGNQADEPRFVNEGKGDLHQKPDSPTIDGGVGQSDLGDTDIDGELRLQGESPDIGADEIDSEITGARVKAKKVQAQGGSTVRIKLKAGAKEPVDVRAKGKVVVGSKSFDLDQVSIYVRSKPKALQLQLEKSDARKVLSELDNGRAADAELVVTFGDDAGNKLRVKSSVGLK